MRRVKKTCVSSSAIPSWWSTQPSRVTLMLKVKSPMATSLLRVGRTAGLSPVYEHLAKANDPAHLPAGHGELHATKSLHAPPVRLYVHFRSRRSLGAILVRGVAGE